MLTLNPPPDHAIPCYDRILAEFRSTGSGKSLDACGVLACVSPQTHFISRNVFISTSLRPRINSARLSRRMVPWENMGGQWLPCVRSFVQGERSRKEGFKCHGKISRFTPWESSYRHYSNGYFANLVRKRRRYPSPEAIMLETRVETEGPASNV